MGRKRKSYLEIKHYFEANSNCKLITTEEEFNEVSKTDYSRSIKFELLCSRCKDKPFTVTMSRFKERNKTICYDCSIKDRSWSIGRVRQFVKDNSDCLLISKTYAGVLEPLTYICKCGEPFQATFTKFKEHNQRHCKGCAEKIRRRKIATYSYQDVLSYVESKGCILLTDEKDYENSMKELWIVGTCNHMFTMSFVDFKKRKESYECPECIGRTDWSISLIKKWMKKYAIGYTLKSKKYTNQTTKLNMECPQGHPFKKDWVHFLRGQRCPICESSSGEQVIEAFLNRKQTLYKRQYWFEDCRKTNPLPFDFAVFRKSDSLKCLIEFDGRQHYQPVDFGNMTMEEAEAEFKERQVRDQIKNDYCKKNHIKLIRIPYWEFSKIDEILSKHL